LDGNRRESPLSDSVEDATTPTPVPRRPQGVSIASTLCWLVGILVALTSVLSLIPAIVTHGVGVRLYLVPVVSFVLAALYLYSGYALRKQQVSGGWTAVMAVALMAALLLRQPSGAGASALGLVVNLAILALVVASWRRLHRRSGSAVAA